MTATTLPALSHQIEAIVAAAIRRAVAQAGQQDALVRRSDHADYQANAALPLAKTVGRAPRDIAESIVDNIDHDAIAATQVSGPGFINVTVADDVIWKQLALRLADPGLRIGQPDSGSTTVIDYSAPNVAKQMHVGHLRTTIIGDALARLLECLGSTVIRQNHLGDWGTQFGMLIQYLDEHPDSAWQHRDEDADPAVSISALDELYRSARSRFDADEAFADRSRDRVVALQAGVVDTRAVWEELVRVSTAAFNAIYTRLGVSLADKDIAGESFYNPLLDKVVAELVETGIATESDGAVCIFDEQFLGPDGNPVPLIIRKKDGGYGYATTDLATIRYRSQELHATRVLYVVDARQRLHFQMVFAAARRAGWLTTRTEVVHTAFGSVLGPDGRPFKTRSGGTVPLAALLDAAVDAAHEVVTDKNPQLTPEKSTTIAEAAGIGAVKYADLSTARTTDYRFDPVAMVALTGNTGVYLQYAHTRTSAILRKAGDADTTITTGETLAPTERSLALHLDAYAAVLRESAELYEPHRICTYLYELAKQFSSYYESTPILRAPTAALRANRLALLTLTQRTLAHGLNILGIEAPQHM